MALIGIARAYKIELRPYLSEYGLSLYEKLQHASITEVLGEYPGLTWSQLAKPEYPTPESIPVYDEVGKRIRVRAMRGWWRPSSLPTAVTITPDIMIARGRSRRTVARIAPSYPTARRRARGRRSPAGTWPEYFDNGALD